MFILTCVHAYDMFFWQLDQFVVDDVQPIMVTDAGLSSHPIVVDVRNPDQINEVFDGISYSKVGYLCKFNSRIF